jgi:endonuclease/exonuclease/phosphatase family metal-dependent hydrolase
MKKFAPSLLCGLSLFAAGLWTAGCAPCGTAPAGPPASAAKSDLPRTAQGEFSVMTFNLHLYTLIDRDGDTDTLEPKPRKEAKAIIETIRLAAPDILAVQEMGGPDAWKQFKRSLQQAGLDYPHEEFLRNGNKELNIALLSRFPVVNSQRHTNDLYTIGPTQFPVQRGILEADIQINPAYRLRLLVAHLKSKKFHEYGQAEMRRNEARLLCNHVRAALKENPSVNLLVVGDLNDDPSSAPLQEITRYQGKAILHDLRPADASGAAWTFRGLDDNHARIDYLLASDGLLPESVLDKTSVVDFPALAGASDHRPVVGTFVAAERGPETRPDLSKRRPAEFPVDD